MSAPFSDFKGFPRFLKTFRMQLSHDPIISRRPLYLCVHFLDFKGLQLFKSLKEIPLAQFHKALALHLKESSTIASNLASYFSR